MMTRRQWFTGMAAVVAVLMCWAGTALAQPFPGGLPRCQANLNTCNASLAAAQHFPASGQTTCWNSAGAVISCAGTGQDGDIQAGATLSYTDNGNGTITDNKTKLMWEKKSADGSIHDVNTVYTWDDAFAVHIAGLNSANFAGHNDWRLPNVKELQSIVNYEKFEPAVSTEFNSNCMSGSTVLTGSCTATPYWTSSTDAFMPTAAWRVVFNDGHVDVGFKFGIPFHVRAVRGGRP